MSDHVSMQKSITGSYFITKKGAVPSFNATKAQLRLTSYLSSCRVWPESSEVRRSNAIAVSVNNAAATPTQMKFQQMSSMHSLLEDDQMDSAAHTVVRLPRRLKCRPGPSLQGDS